MFTGLYFAARYFAARFFPKIGGELQIICDLNAAYSASDAVVAVASSAIDVTIAASTVETQIGCD